MKRPSLRTISARQGRSGSGIRGAIWIVVASCMIAPRGAAAGPTDDKSKGGDYVEIAGTGQSLYRIAIPPIITHGGWSKKRVRTLRTVLSNDLELFGLFKTLNPKGFLANLKAEGTSIRPRDWINVGAQAVVKARAWRLGRVVEVHWFLYDVSKGTTPVLKKVHKGRNLRRLAHRFGNDIVYYFTKRRGVFLTKITFASGNRKTGWSQVYAMDFDGYGRHRVSPYGRQNILPSWSPSGRITYTGFLWQNPISIFCAESAPTACRASRVSTSAPSGRPKATRLR